MKNYIFIVRSMLQICNDWQTKCKHQLMYIKIGWNDSADWTTLLSEWKDARPCLLKTAALRA